MLARRSRAEVGDHLGRAAVRLSRKQPVEIAFVERREPPARRDGREVEGGQDEGAPAHVARFEPGYAALFLLVHAMTADKILKEIEGYGGTRAKNVAR